MNVNSTLINVTTHDAEYLFNQIHWVYMYRFRSRSGGECLS